jgi:hypothetical protein
VVNHIFFFQGSRREIQVKVECETRFGLDARIDGAYAFAPESKQTRALRNGPISPSNLAPVALYPLANTMSFKFDFDIDDIDEELDSTLQIAGSQPSEAKDEAHPTIPSQEHSIEQFVRNTPFLVSELRVPNFKHPIKLSSMPYPP